jgi:hypothetical protein
MLKSGFFANWKNIKKISFGLVTTLFLIWLIFNTAHFVPASQKDNMLIAFISYGILGAMVFAFADIRNKLFNINFWKSLPRFFLFFIISLIGFYVILKFTSPVDTSFSELLSSVPVWLAMIHCFVYATIESAVWQGFLDDVVGRIFSCIIAGLFHMFVWGGSVFFAFLGSAILFLIFSFIHYYFRKNKNDLIPVIAVHTAYNIIKLGFFFS